ncbi:ditrans,polycis-polyprenyl diphosphate synthase [Nematocida sp. AWRm80]|nr:ditrans,polycis-polyprenyl diphosphate synthase [Nematocida sp. AWRm80]
MILSVIEFLIGSQALNGIYEYLQFYCSTGIIDRMVTYFSRGMGKDISIGMIMDGNRRYSRWCKKPLEYGYLLGYKQLLSQLKYLHSLECKSICLFAFGMNNFKRDKKELDGLMKLLKSKFSELSDQMEKEEYLKGIKIVGNKNYFPKEFQKTIDKINSAPGRKRIFVLFCYSSMDKYFNNEKDGVPEMDIIIRPGGEKRLSDFLLCSAATRSTICFLATKWPALSRFHVLLCVVKFKLERMIRG